MLVEATVNLPAIKPIAVKLEVDIRERMKRLAEVRHRTTHWLMREAIEQYVDREEKQAAFRENALKVWEEYQLTGLHVSHQEADTWLAKLESGEDVEPPECQR